MLQQKQDVIETSIHAAQSLRSANPTIIVAKSIYQSEGRVHSIINPDTASVIAPSDLEFEFDNMIINSQAYRRAFAKAHQAQAEARDVDAEELGDLIDFTDYTDGQHPPRSEEAVQAPFSWHEGTSRCMECNEKIFGTFLRLEGNRFHISCFKCSVS